MCTIFTVQIICDCWLLFGQLRTLTLFVAQFMRPLCPSYIGADITLRGRGIEETHNSIKTLVEHVQHHCDIDIDIFYVRSIFVGRQVALDVDHTISLSVLVFCPSLPLTAMKILGATDTDLLGTVDDATPGPERLRHVPKILVSPKEGARGRRVVGVTRGRHGC